jgi:hypothetical protein
VHAFPLLFGNVIARHSTLRLGPILVARHTVIGGVVVFVVPAVLVVMLVGIGIIRMRFLALVVFQEPLLPALGVERLTGVGVERSDSLRLPGRPESEVMSIEVSEEAVSVLH